VEPEKRPVVPDMSEIEDISNLIATQNNRCTDQPMFIVQERIRDYGYDHNYADEYVWLNAKEEHREATHVERAGLDSLDESDRYTPPEWEKVYYKDRWQFVTACFTESGCKEYIVMDGHNHGGAGNLRIYTCSSHRNHEFQTVRNFLLSFSNKDKESGQ
jgi:hypothetical protein